jgi:hypothetical protein
METDGMTTHELDLDALKALHSKVIGFVFQPREGGWTGEQRTFAELGEDGKWKYWDMNTALSREACEFIVAAHEAFPALVARIEAAEAFIRQLSIDTAGTGEYGYKEEWAQAGAFVAWRDAAQAFLAKQPSTE